MQSMGQNTLLTLYITTVQKFGYLMVKVFSTVQYNPKPKSYLIQKKNRRSRKQARHKATGWILSS